MNDFTKEELQWLGEELDLAASEYECPDIAYSIRDKIAKILAKDCGHDGVKWKATPICPECTPCFLDSGDDIEARLNWLLGGLIKEPKEVK